MLVAIPSKGRAGRTRSDVVLPSAKLFVPRLEAIAYRKASKCEVVAVPDSVRGITPTRNWILDWAGKAGIDRVVQVDDDVRTCGYIELLADRSKKRRMTEADFLAEFDKLFDLTEDLGYRIWGVDTVGATRALYPFKPFLWQTYVTGSCMGIRRDTGIRFDESFTVKEDYEITLRCIKEDGGVVGARYFCWVNSHWTDAGGCKDYRTQTMEEQTIRRLIRMYPGMIRRVTKGGSGYSVELEF